MLVVGLIAVCELLLSHRLLYELVHDLWTESVRHSGIVKELLLALASVFLSEVIVFG